MNRSKSFIVRMTDDEMTMLDIKVKRTGMSRERYVRTLCNNKRPVEIPPADYYTLIEEVRSLGDSMSRIAHLAATTGVLDAPTYRTHADHVLSVADTLTAVCLPKDSS